MRKEGLSLTYNGSCPIHIAVLLYSLTFQQKVVTFSSLCSLKYQCEAGLMFINGVSPIEYHIVDRYIALRSIIYYVCVSPYALPEFVGMARRSR